MNLHLVELPLDLRRLHRWAGNRKLMPGSSFDEGLALHHLLGEVFGPAVLQPFRLLVAPRARAGTLYAYAQQDAESLRNTAAMTAGPSETETIDLSRLRSVPRPPGNWREGQRLGFDLRLRPVVRLASGFDGQTESGAPVKLGKGAEIDAFLATTLRDQETSREGAYLGWLGRRLGKAARLEPGTSKLVRFERSRISRNGRSVEGPDAVVHGTLSVIDPGDFAALLARGVGRHRSYGYGMLLLRPPQRRVSC